MRRQHCTLAQRMRPGQQAHSQQQQRRPFDALFNSTLQYSAKETTRLPRSCQASRKIVTPRTGSAAARCGAAGWCRTRDCAELRGRQQRNAQRSKSRKDRSCKMTAVRGSDRGRNARRKPGASPPHGRCLSQASPRTAPGQPYLHFRVNRTVGLTGARADYTLR